MAAHRYWRLYMNSCVVTSNDLAQGQIAFCTSYAGATVTGSGTAAASSTGFGLPPANCFTGNINDFWHSNATGAQWVSYDFGSGNDKDIVEIGLTVCPGRANQLPDNIDVQYSDDNISWTTAWSINPIPWSNFNSTNAYGIEKRFTNPSVAGSDKLYWRVFPTTITDATHTIGMNEMTMATSSGGTNVCTGGILYAENQFNTSTFSAANAFDSNPSTNYSGKGDITDPTQLPSGIGYHFTSSKNIKEVKMTCRTDGSTEQTPHIFNLDSSPDGLNWTTEATFTALTWSSNNTQTFTISSGESADITSTFSGISQQINAGLLSQAGITTTLAGISQRIDSVVTNFAAVTTTLVGIGQQIQAKTLKAPGTGRRQFWTS